MAAETELEKLVVRLVGDADSFLKALAQAQAEAQKTAQEVEAAGQRIEGFGSKLTAVGERAASALAGLGAGAILKEALGNFQEAEDIGLRLNAVLETNGREVAALTERYDQFAKALEKTTTMEDDAVLAMLATAESFDLTAAKAEEAVQNAIALAAVNGGVAESYLRITAAMAEGDMEKAMGMARMIPQLRGVKDEAEFAAKFLKLTASGMKAAEAAAQSSSGQFKTLKRDFGNLLEELGGFVARAINPVVEGLKVLVAWFRGLDEGAKVAVTAVLGLAAGLGTLTAAFGFAALTNPLTWLAAAAGAAVFFTAKIVGSTEAVKEFRQQLQQAKEQSEFVKKSFAENPLAVKAKVEALPGAERKDALAKEMQLAEAMVQIHQRALKRIEADREEAFGAVGGDPLGNMGRALAELGPRGTVFAEAIKNAQQELDAARVNAQAVRKQFELLAGGGMTEQVRKDVQKLNAELERTIRQSGMSDLEKKLDDLRQKGATGPEVARTEALIRMAKDAEAFKKAQEEAAEATRKLNDEAADMASSLEAEIATFGMSAEAAKLFKLEMLGLDEATAGHLRGLMEQKDALEAQKKLLEEGARVTEQVLGKDPARKFGMEMEKLEKLLDAGAIDFDIFELAVAQANEELAKSGKHAKKAHDELKKFDAAASGSAEALQRIEAFRDRIGLPALKGTDGASAVVKQAAAVAAEGEGHAAARRDFAPWRGGTEERDPNIPGNFRTVVDADFDPRGFTTRDYSEDAAVLLKDIRDLMKEQGKNVFRLEPVGLEG